MRRGKNQDWAQEEAELQYQLSKIPPNSAGSPGVSEYLASGLKGPTCPSHVLHSNRRALGRKQPGTKQLSAAEAKLKELTDGGCLFPVLLRWDKCSPEEGSGQCISMSTIMTPL